MAPGDLERFWDRHIQDSLRALPVVETSAAGPCVDVGSGAGLPGIPLAIALPDRHWRLLEPRARRAAFLEEVVRELELDCEVMAVTAEDAAVRWGPIHALAIARALAPPGAALELLAPLLAPGGVAVVFIGREAELPPDAEEAVPGLAIMRR